LIGRKILTAQRGGSGIPEVIYTGVPDGSQALWNTVTGDFTTGGADWLDLEKLTLLFV
jgi:hypothetical protein